MKNEHILNLTQEVPATIRLEVYKEALGIIKSGDIFEPINEKCKSYGLCLLLPCLLWGLRDMSDRAPDGWCWEHGKTSRAFPELTKKAIVSIGITETGDLGDGRRIELLELWITKLENYETA